MPLRLNTFERLIFYQANLGPGPMVDLLGALAFKAVAAGVELGLFEALAEGPLSPRDLADRIDASERGTRFLLDALEPLGYVSLEGDRYLCSSMATKWLLSSAETPLGDLFLFFQDMVSRWEHLPEAVRRGETPYDVGAWLSEAPGGWDRYHAGMRAISAMLSDELVSRVPLPGGAKKLLDLGGSHGLHAARFCRRHTALHATILDQAHARPLAEATIEAEAVGERVGFREGDFMVDDLGEGWDVVLLFNVIRALPREELDRLFGRVHAALSPRGRVVVMDQLAAKPSSPFVRANARLIDLELMVSSPGEVYRADEVLHRLEGAGLQALKSFDLRRAGGQGVVIAERAG